MSRHQHFRCWHKKLPGRRLPRPVVGEALTRRGEAKIAEEEMII